MIKFLILSCLILYLLSKIGGFFFRAGIASQQFRTQDKKEGSVNVNEQPKKTKKGGSIKGGDYVDYEEVK